MEKVYITNDLAEFLNLNPNEPYKESELKKLIKTKFDRHFTKIPKL